MIKRLKSEHGSVYMSLSLSLPALEELEEALQEARYLLVKRSGFVMSENYAKEQSRKRDLAVLLPPIPDKPNADRLSSTSIASSFLSYPNENGICMYFSRAPVSIENLRGIFMMWATAAHIRYTVMRNPSFWR